MCYKEQKSTKKYDDRLIIHHLFQENHLRCFVALKKQKNWNIRAQRKKILIPNT